MRHLKLSESACTVQLMPPEWSPAGSGSPLMKKYEKVAKRWAVWTRPALECLRCSYLGGNECEALSPPTVIHRSSEADWHFFTHLFLALSPLAVVSRAPPRQPFSFVRLLFSSVCRWRQERQVFTVTILSTRQGTK